MQRKAQNMQGSILAVEIESITVIAFYETKWTSSALTSSGEDLSDYSHKIIEIFLKWKSGHVIQMCMYFCFW